MAMGGCTVLRSESMAESRSKRAVLNYSGLAALVTSVSGILTLWIGQASDNTQSQQVQATMLALMQYRLQVVEISCGVTTPSHHHPESPDSYLYPEEEEEVEAETPESHAGELEGASDVMVEADLPSTPHAPPESPERALKRKFTAKRNLDLADIQEYVQKSGKSLSLESF